MPDGTTVLRISRDREGSFCVEKMIEGIDFDGTQRIIACLEVAKHMLIKDIEIDDMDDGMVDDTRKLLDG